jgi:hypothetical protein
MKAPSKKQMDYADEIADCLGIDFPNSSADFTAQSYYNFIKAHINDYYELVGYPDTDEDYLDWIGAYENDVWCEHY